MTHEPSVQEILTLKKELVGLFGHLQKIRKELASLNPPGAPDHFGSMSDELDEIVSATEKATNTIMESVEGIDTLMNDARAATDDPKLKAVFDGVTDKVNMVFEACSFQDITGQRVTKVVNSMKFVEERINSIIITWGRDELTKVVVEIKEDTDPDKKLLHGPQLTGKGVTQAEVDAMLGQDDIDKLFG
ncbi:protein phosphatase CheZ [Magnetospirillum sp. UT-4]|uniref:protein phosphatase CheZ n=1 Tax=Magnetospirillum sp. UT-4 TaxID=2681467 RepID=UPI00137E94EE|nr:protein phosphatase CheZ [Magnetospirillum sp. UT-4]CAA7624425.1 Protein phosphatase CheZ [Magnetospirillum sp. UT-4]